MDDNMNLIRIVISDNFFVDYDKSRGMYRFTVNEPDYYVAEFWFDAYDDSVIDWNSFASGAVALMQYMHDYYKGAEPIWPSEMEGILEEFLRYKINGKEV